MNSRVGEHSLESIRGFVNSRVGEQSIGGFVNSRVGEHSLESIQGLVSSRVGEFDGSIAHDYGSTVHDFDGC